MNKKCEGYRRHGGAFTLGPVTWTQCKENGIVLLTFKGIEGEVQTLPACNQCWNEFLESGGKVIKVKPIK